MKILKSIRQQLGLTQREMAELLGITRQLYALAETNRRMINAVGAGRLAEIIPLLPDQKQIKAVKAILSGEERELLEEQLISSRLELSRIKKELVDMKTRYRQGLDLELFLKRIQKTPGAKMKLSLLEELTLKIKLQKEQNNPGLQVWPTIQIKSLIYRIKLLEAALALER